MPQKCQNSDSQFPNKMKVSIKIIGNPLSILVALNAESAGTSPHAARAEEEGSVKWWTTFPSHHFSMPYINHLHPIMIKSGTMIMSFYCGPGTWSFFSMISKHEKEWHFIFAPGGHVRLINGNQLQWRGLSCIKCLDCQPRSSHLICTQHTHSVCPELEDALFWCFMSHVWVDAVTLVGGWQACEELWKTPSHSWQIYVYCYLRSGCNFHVWLEDNPKEEVSIHTKCLLVNRRTE